MRTFLAALLILPLLAAASTPGLRVDAQGQLCRDGKPYRGIGVN